MSSDLKMNKPDFVIIGAMKSATSSLAEQLGKQNGVFMTEPKEPNFFSNDEIYARGEHWYSSLFDAANVTDIKGEASTHYTKLPKYPETIARLKRYCPDTKLIYIMRHPVDRLVSHFTHNWTMAMFQKDMPIETAIKEYAPLIEYGLYKKQLDPWLEAFGHECILPVFFNSLLSEPQQELERIAKFIGIDGDVVWNQKTGANQSVDRYRRIPFQEAIIESKVGTFLRRSIVPKSLRESIRNRRSKGADSNLSESNIVELESTFNKDLSELGKLFDIELNCKNFKDVTKIPSLEWKIAKNSSDDSI